MPHPDAFPEPTSRNEEYVLHDARRTVDQAALDTPPLADGPVAHPFDQLRTDLAHVNELTVASDALHDLTATMEQGQGGVSADRLAKGRQQVQQRRLDKLRDGGTGFVPTSRVGRAALGNAFGNRQRNPNPVQPETPSTEAE